MTIGGTTLYQDFGVIDFSPTAGYHVPLVCGSYYQANGGAQWIHNASFGANGANPVTSLDMSDVDDAVVDDLWLGGMWYIEDNVYIDSVRVWAASDEASSAESVNINMMSYSYDESSGDLSDGVVVANSSSTLEPIVGAPKTSTLTIDSDYRSITAGKVVYVFFENVDGTDDISVKCQVKYHLV